MDPEDLLDQEVELIPGLESHAEANMETLKMLDSLDVSYRYCSRSIHSSINHESFPEFHSRLFCALLPFVTRNVQWLYQLTDDVCICTHVGTPG